MTKLNSERISFARTKNQLSYPDFLEIQLKSFHDFFQLETTPENRKNEGLFRVFQENFPITDTRNNFVLEFMDYFVDPPRYSIEECIERGLTYSVPLKAKLKLYCTDPEHEDFDTVIQDVYLGTIPYMTERGLFVINGLAAWEWGLANQYRYNIRIVSNSYGSGGPFNPDNPITRASKMAYDRNMTIVFAAGNDGPVKDTYNTYAKAP